MPRPSAIDGLLLRCLTTALLLQSIRASTEANSPYEFAKLIEVSPPGSGQVIHVQNYTVTTPSNSVFKELETDDRCSCRLVCNAIIPPCSTMSYDPDTKSCTLANGIERATPTPGASYTYLMKENSRITHENDGLYYYMVLNEKTFSEARTECYRRGFRLAIAKTVATAEVFKMFHEGFTYKNYWINLVNLDGSSGQANLRWGDDTSVESAIFGTLGLVQNGSGGIGINDWVPFVISRLGPEFNDRWTGYEEYFLCQANFDGITPF